MRKIEILDAIAFFISDWHLFHPYSRVKMQDILLTCANASGSLDALYMVGDMIDFEFLLHRLDKMIEKGICTRDQIEDFDDFLARIPRKKHEKDFDPHEHYRILDRILTLARGGTNVIWPLGNHDEILEPLAGQRINDILFAPDAVFETRHGKKNPSISRYAVTHGHTFDPAYLRRNTQWYRRGSAALDWIIECDLDMQKKLPAWEFYFASAGKKICKALISDFRKAALADAVAKGMDGVICGHIHVADYTLDEKTGLIYMNCGDGFTHGTAISYGKDRHWRVLNAKDLKAQFNYASTLSPDSPVHPETRRFMNVLWQQALTRHFGLTREDAPRSAPGLTAA